MIDLAAFHRRLVLHGGKKPYERLFLFLLLPFSLLYGGIGWLRWLAYRTGLFSSFRAPVKVVSVGNLAVGGTGKTPLVDWLVKYLLSEGKRPAVVSRGYGGTFSGDVGVVCSGQGPQLSPAEAGDEPCLLARRNPTVPVVIARKRTLGVRAVIEKFAADIVILDDGFQHHAVQRDLDLVLVDGKFPLGNGMPLPVGVLREFPGALRRADLLLFTRVTEDAISPPVAKPSWKSRHQLAEYAIGLEGKRVSLADLKGKRLLAFAGIAAPENFFQGLEAAGLKAEKKLSFSDHQRYDKLTVSQIRSAAEQSEFLLTTEKDGIKLTPGMFSIPCYQVPMNIEVENEVDFKAEIFRRLWRN